MARVEAGQLGLHGREVEQVGRHQLAQLPVELRFPAHGVQVLEPRGRERRAVQEQPVDVDEAAAAVDK